LNNVKKGEPDELCKSIIFIGKLIKNMRKQKESKILTEYSRILTDIFVEYLHVSSENYEGPNSEIVKMILKRGKCLMKLELMKAKSVDNIGFIEKNLGDSGKLNEIKEKIMKERKRIRLEQKFEDLSVTLLKNIKEMKNNKEEWCEKIKEWCRMRPVKNAVKYIWMLIDSIKDKAISLAKENLSKK